ncbi:MULTISPECIES: class A beta-lactamase [unclassified Streptomyces]|uniref:class A beta-lactamase n=1 Tax=unclassified Streptomyces TaxID=2593676 RepID=UPI00035F908C|nr:MULTISPECIES: class A beta-lactamase [unclassified Streptomyces]MYT28582.1 class A beta-lactamase [Streptomyces sp. SID8354]
MTSATPLPRRRLLRAGLAASTTALLASAGSPADAVASRQLRWAAGELDELRALERRYGARLGVYAHNVRTGQTVAHRAQERFAMCSTFKTVAAAAVLRDQAHCAPLDKVIHYPAADLVPYSPKTKEHVDSGMTVGDLCAAAIQYSDNTAGNLLLRQIGGPAGLTRFFRSIGDPVSRLDRWEPDLNSARPGDLRDTTTPEAIGRSYGQLTVGRALAADDRERLVDWLRGNTTSAQRFRAGLPHRWVVGDKTGTGDYASANDVGVAWTTRKTPIVLAVLTSKTSKDAPVDDALIADAARIVARTLAPGE